MNDELELPDGWELGEPTYWAACINPNCKLRGMTVWTAIHSLGIEKCYECGALAVDYYEELGKQKGDSNE